MKAFKFVSACLTVSVAAFVLPAQAQSVSGQGSWETRLLGRDIDRNAVAATDASAVYLYDTTLDVTWLRDANVNGALNWLAANTWASSLVTGSGADAIDDWALPTMTDPLASAICTDSNTNCGWNVATSSSQTASLFFNTLGNKSFYNTSGEEQAGWGLTNAGSFKNMQSDNYWLGTEYAPSSAWHFNVGYGVQGLAATSGQFSAQFYAMAVRPGDVLAAVPEPETYAMMLTGLAMVGALSRRRSRAARPLAL